MKRCISHNDASTTVKNEKRTFTDNINMDIKKEPLDHQPPYQTIIRTNWNTTLIILDVLGEGVYGKVLSVSENNNKYALKLFKSTHSERINETFKREIDIMKTVTKSCHPNLVKLVRGGNLATYPEGFLEIGILMELKGPSLFVVMERAKHGISNQETISFQIPVIRQIGSQVLSAMKQLEKLNILHLDLKPENIYFASNCTFETICEGGVHFIKPSRLHVCVGDFGNSRFFLRKNMRIKSEVVQTQNYRSPEIFLGLPITMKSDVWSFACVLCEMYTGELLFYGTVNPDTEAVQFEMMQIIVEQEPSPSMLKQAANIGSKRIVLRNEENIFMKNSISYLMETPLPLTANIRENDNVALPLFDLLQYTLIFDPTDRPTFEDVASHKFFN